MSRLNVVSFGIGVIGGMTAKHMIEKRKDRIELVGAFDIDPAKVGKDLGEILGLGTRVGVKVSNDLNKVLDKDVDVVIHTTTSSFRKAYPQILEVIKRKVDMVSSCEELSYPYSVDRTLSMDLDEAAKKNGVSVLGTGINPGFLMDTLPITLTAPCETVERIHVTRVMDAANRRVPFQKKVGVGMTVDEFTSAIADNKITGHIGLRQSIAMIADAVGWKLDKIEVGEVEPVLVRVASKAGFTIVHPGEVSGVKQSARGVKGSSSLIELSFSAYVGAEEEYDKVEIQGTPPINCRISPCVHGDSGTVAMLANMVPKVYSSPPGLYTMKDMQLPSARL